MKREIIVISAILLFLVNVIDVSAGNKVENINVTTKVIPFVKYEIIHQEKKLVITEGDIIRGFVDTQRALIFSVRTNSSNGYLLAFSAGNNLFKEARVFNEKNSYRLSASGGELFFPYQGMNYVTKELSIRFYLSSNTRPGSYEWPLSLMITAM